MWMPTPCCNNIIKPVSECTNCLSPACRNCTVQCHTCLRFICSECYNDFLNSVVHEFFTKRIVITNPNGTTCTLEVFVCGQCN